MRVFKINYFSKLISLNILLISNDPLQFIYAYSFRIKSVIVNIIVITNTHMTKNEIVI